MITAFLLFAAAPALAMSGDWQMPCGSETVIRISEDGKLDVSMRTVIRGKDRILKFKASVVRNKRRISLKGAGHGFRFVEGGTECHISVLNLSVSAKCPRRRKPESLRDVMARLSGKAVCGGRRIVTVKIVFTKGSWKRRRRK